MWAVGAIGSAAKAAMGEKACKAVTGLFTASALPENVNTAKEEMKTSFSSHAVFYTKVNRLTPEDKITLLNLTVNRDIGGLEKFFFDHGLSTEGTGNYSSAQALTKFKCKAVAQHFQGKAIPDTGFELIQSLFSTRRDPSFAFYDVLNWCETNIPKNADPEDFSHIKDYYTFLKKHYGLHNDFELFNKLHSLEIHWHPHMTFEGVTFNVQMNDNVMAHSTFKDCTFPDKCNFSNTNLENSTFTSCTSPEACFLNTNLKSVTILHHHGEQSKFKNADLSNSTIKHSHFKDSTLSGSDRRGTHTSLENATIEHSDFTNAHFAEVKMEGAHVDHGTLDSVTFENMDLSQTTFTKNCTLENAKATNCQLGENATLFTAVG